MTRQAILLGWCPRLQITQTSSEGYGQIYVGVVNWMLMAVTIGLTLGFRKSDNLAAAYGIAVSLTMLFTSVLLFIAMREIWRWPTALAAGVAGCFGVIDAGFAAANGMKFFEGGWVPLLLATLVWAVMDLWHRGTAAVAARLHEGIVPVDAFLADIQARAVARVPGTAVFMTRTQAGTPPVMVWHVRQNRALHQNLVVVNVTIAAVPHIAATERLKGEQVAPGFWRLAACYGFMERPNIPVLLAGAEAVGCKMPFDDVTYYVGHEQVLPREKGGGWSAWLVSLFAFMVRNSATVAGALQLPCDRVVEIGRLVEI
jgi:KUP system potassium uptake protein